MPIEGEEEREITNATKGTTDVSGSDVLKYQEQMTRPQVPQNTAGYQTYDNGTIAGKANTNDLPPLAPRTANQLLQT